MADYTFRLRVVPGASKNELILTSEGCKLRLQAPAVEGKANKACIQFLSKLFGIPKRRIAILQGARARTKQLTVYDVTRDEVTVSGSIWAGVGRKGSRLGAKAV